MAKDIPTISAQLRDRIGTRYAARLREQGQLPAVMYGHKEEPLSVALDSKQFAQILDGPSHLMRVDVAGKPQHCLIREVQWNHLGTAMIHADLTRVDMTEEVEIEIELQLTGDPEALKEPGAYLDQQTNTITVACRADAIPDELTLDIGELELNHWLTVADLSLPKGVRAVTEEETPIAAIHIAAEAPEEEEEEATEGEPEVLTEKPEEGEESKGE